MVHDVFIAVATAHVARILGGVSLIDDRNGGRILKWTLGLAKFLLNSDLSVPWFATAKAKRDPTFWNSFLAYFPRHPTVIFLPLAVLYSGSDGSPLLNLIGLSFAPCVYVDQSFREVYG